MKIKLLVKIFILLLTGVFTWLLTSPVLAQTKPAWVTPAFPIRGQEFWTLEDQTPYDNFMNYRRLVDDNQLAATWLFRYDALFDDQIYTSARLFPSNQQRGLFLEITPQLATDAQVPYRTGGGWSDSNRVYISGYSLEQRKRLIDTAVSRFLRILGHYPRVVAAWHIDAWSANYLSRSYGINSIIICADQYATDQYQLWGGWWGVPYYPSKNNILIPAQTVDYKLPLVVSQWAARDPLKGYGGGVQASTYSVQVNDYLLHNLGVNYFEQLLNIYTQNANNQFGYLLIGIENDYDWEQYQQEISDQLAIVGQYQTENKLKTITMDEFSHWYQQSFPNLSPPHKITNEGYHLGLPIAGQVTNSTSQNNTVTWEMTPQYRLGYLINQQQITVFDYRIYDQRFSEPYLETKNQFARLNLVDPAQIDTVTFPQQAKRVDAEQLDQLRHPATPRLPFQTSWKSVAVWYGVLLIVLIILARKSLFLTLLLLAGTVTISLPMVKSGWLYPFGMGFWGPNGHDGIWHLSLIEHFSRSWDFNSPIMSGTKLTNYHFLFDLLLALINRLTPFWSATTLYFQIIPPLLAVLLGWLTYQFTLTWSQSKLSAYLAVILIYFGSGFGWLVSLLRDHNLGGESVFWSTQAISTLINPPFALSLVLLLTGLILFQKYQHKKVAQEPKLFILTSVIFGLLIHAKSYAGILILGSLAILSLFEIIKIILSRKDIKGQLLKLNSLKILILSSVIALVTFLPVLDLSKTSLIFSPFWFPHTMLLFSDRFHWPELYNAIPTYWATHNYPKALAAELLALVIFLAGNLGVRLIGGIYVIKGLLASIKTKQYFPAIDWLLIYIVVIATIIPLLFIQTGTPWNTIQFFYYALVMMSLFTARILGSWLNQLPAKKVLTTGAKIVTFGTIFALSFPTTVGTLQQYLPYRAPARIPYEELAALEFLSHQPQGVVLTYPFDEQKVADYGPPKPLAYYVSTAYVSAMSGHPVYLEDEINLDIITSGIEWQERKQTANQFFLTLNPQSANQFLDQQSIAYLYLLRGQPLNLHLDQLRLEKIFDNGLVTIYQRQS